MARIQDVFGVQKEPCATNPPFCQYADDHVLSRARAIWVVIQLLQTRVVELHADPTTVVLFQCCNDPGCMAWSVRDLSAVAIPKLR